MRIVFMGSPAFAVPSLQALATRVEIALVVTQPDKPSGRGRTLTPPPVKVAALAANVPVYQPSSAKTEEFLATMRGTGAQLAVVVAYGKILPQAVLDAFPLGCLNVHASLLPAYRGAAPIQWAVINGEKRTGVAIMQLEAGLDTGPVFATTEVEIGAAETSGQLMDRLAMVGAQTLVDSLPAIAAGTLPAVRQDDAKATYASMFRKGHGGVDFARRASQVAALVRGVDPWPGAEVADACARASCWRGAALPWRQIGDAR
ncbi:MAG: methionyl-tRNA formyltransferase [Myxococcales bacterium]|nr:methionyl-tRNA formyltransferase [Myxococcales bacterium]